MPRIELWWGGSGLRALRYTMVLLTVYPRRAEASMDKPMARVVCLPTAGDVREEAERMGVAPSALVG